MAKRKRLALLDGPVSTDLETKQALSRARMPIADVAGETAGRAALEEVAREMTAAETEGRIVKKLPLAQITIDHLTRDRMVLDEDEMVALTGSIGARGQQTPIEVVQLGEGRYGLISGLRRIEALRALGRDRVLALIKAPQGSQDAYQAMVEENEIRAGLSFYERAHIAVAAVEQGVYDDVRSAVKSLFANAPKAKRSKISKFVTLCDALGAALRFPAAIPEHLGFALAQAIEADPRLAKRITRTLAASPPDTAADERKTLEAMLQGGKAAAPVRRDIAPDLSLQSKQGRVVLSGKAVDEAFIAALTVWAAKTASS